MSKAVKGSQPYSYEIWISPDAAPYINGDLYKTWFYFSVTGIPQGETATFTFKNLNNQVSGEISFYHHLSVDETVLSGTEASIQGTPHVTQNLETHSWKS